MISETSTTVGYFSTRLDIKNNNQNICETGIEYLGHSREGYPFKDVCCSFKLHLDIIHKLENIDGGRKYLGRYWKIFFKKRGIGHYHHLFYMNTYSWWTKENYYNTLKIIPGYWTNNVDVIYS